MFKLPTLSYQPDQLAPNISKETFEYHFGKHTKTYVDNLNKFLEGEGAQFKGMSLENIVRESSGPIYNNAAQSWNHAFYWLGLAPQANRKKEPTGALADAIKRDFGDLKKFKDDFKASALKVFGSGWTWVVKDKAGKLSFVNTSNADGPLKTDNIPVVVCDVWEHAYYIDTRNDRGSYFEKYFEAIDWNFCEKNYQGSKPYDITANMKA